MGKILILKPGAVAETVEHEGNVGLADLYRLIDCGTVDRRGMGAAKKGLHEIDIWFDDEGLLNEAAPNRRIHNGKELGPVICGTILVCASTEDGDSIPMTDEETELALAHVSKWDILAPVNPKPEPSITITEIGR